MTAETETVHCPVYRDKDGNEFIITHEEFVGHSYDEAWQIAMSTKLVECILLGITYQRIEEIDPKNFPHQRTTLAQYSVALISGPAFQPETPE